MLLIDKIKSKTDGEEDIDADEDEFCGLEWNLVEKELSMKKIRTWRSLGAHQTSCLAKNFREGVDKFHNGIQAIDELPALFPIILELIPVLFEYLKDGLR